MALADKLPVSLTDIAVNALEIIGQILKDVTKDPLEAVKLARTVYDRVEHALNKSVQPDEIRIEQKGLLAAVSSTADEIDNEIDRRFVR